ncbi:MAG: ribonuclease P protein component [Nocardioidaceae bacterium]
MLPRSNRLTRSADFQTVVRRGRRAASATMVLHAAAANVSPRAAETGLDPQSRSGGGRHHQAFELASS